MTAFWFTGILLVLYLFQAVYVFNRVPWITIEFYFCLIATLSLMLTSSLAASRGTAAFTAAAVSTLRIMIAAPPPFRCGVSIKCRRCYSRAQLRARSDKYIGREQNKNNDSTSKFGDEYFGCCVINNWKRVVGRYMNIYIFIWICGYVFTNMIQYYHIN